MMQTKYFLNCLIARRKLQNSSKNTYSDGKNKDRLGKKLFALAAVVVLMVPAASPLIRQERAQAAPSSNIPQAFPAATATEIGGLIFRDFNANGTMDSQEPGFRAILDSDQLTVTAYDEMNIAAGTTTTDSSGQFVITGLIAGEPYRLEVSGLPTYLQAGSAHAGNDQPVASESFTFSGTNNTLIGVNNPGEFCQSIDNVDLATPCYINGDPLLGGANETLDAFVSVKYDATAKTALVQAKDIGSTYGVAYNPDRNSYYASAFMKRHVGLGPLGEGGIYEIDATTGAVSSLFTVAGMSSIVRTDLTGTGNDSSHDPNAFAAVGKTSLGDIEYDYTSNTLYAMNLEARQVEVISIDPTTGVASAGTPIAVTDPGCVGGDHRPFATSIKDGALIVGVTCDASISKDAADLDGYIMRYNGASFVNLKKIDLDYTMEPSTNEDNDPYPLDSYVPWADTFTDLWPTPTQRYIELGAAQPVVSDITFDNDNSIVVSIMDRSSHQLGWYNYEPDVSSTQTYFQTLNGDTLRLCYDEMANEYDLEGTGICPQHTDTEGFLDEYYNGDSYPRVGTFEHLETTQGGATIIPGQEHLVGTFMDPQSYSSAGLQWLNNDTGEEDDDFEIFQSNGSPPTPETFSKAGGLGDLEATCRVAPIEIGNRIWLDANGDGIQSPWSDANTNGVYDAGEEEFGVNGVTVNLYDKTTNTIVGTAVTDIDGNYVFRGHNYDYVDAQDSSLFAHFSDDPDPDQADHIGIVPGGIIPGRDYVVRADNASDYPAGKLVVSSGGATTVNNAAIVGESLRLTLSNAGEISQGDQTDVRENDGVESNVLGLVNGNFPEIDVYQAGSDDPATLGGAGANNHSFDFGFTLSDGRIGNQLFQDTDNNGIFDTGEPGIEGVTVELFTDVDADGIFEPGGDDGTVTATRTTDVNGRYWFEGLGDGDYFAAIPDSNTSVTIGTDTVDLNDMFNSNSSGLSNHTASSFEPTTDTNVDNDDDGRDAGNTAIPAGYITMSDRVVLATGTEPLNETLPGGAAGDDETEANAQVGSSSPSDDTSNLTVDFGFYSLPDISLAKQVDVDGDASFTNSEVLPKPGFAGNPDPSVFQYRIEVTNQGLADASGVIVQDDVPAGVTIDSVSSVSTGSVTTGLPITGTTVEWNIGAIASGATETLVINASLSVANEATFIAGFNGTGTSQNVSQVTAMTEDDIDSTTNNVVIPFVPVTSEDDEDDARVTIPPALGNYVWQDTDGDGDQDAGEPGIAGVTVNLYIDDDGTAGQSAGDTLDKTTTTDTDGLYYFGDLTAGVDYYIEFDHTTTPAEVEPTVIDNTGDDATDSDGDVATGYTGLYTLAAGEVDSTVDMGYSVRPSLGDFVWEDTNDNNQQDAGEPGIAGVTVNLHIDDDGTAGQSAGDTLDKTTTTDTDGLYYFGDLTAGVDYYIEFDHTTAPAGHYPSTQDIGDDATDSDGDSTTGFTGIYTLANAQQDLTVDMGYVPHFSIGNRVFLDDGSGSGTIDDGTQQAGEGGIASVDLRLLDGSGTPVDDPNQVGTQDYVITTDSNGYYRFDQLLAGNYIVEVLNTSIPVGLAPSTGQTTTNSPDQKDHGEDTLTSGYYRSNVVTLSTGSQPTDESDLTTGLGDESTHGDANSNLAVDFGFVPVTDLTITKNVTPIIYSIGITTAVTYTVDVTNNGLSDVTSMAVADTQPSGVTFTSWTCSITTPAAGSLTQACANANGSGNISETVTLNSGGVATYTITASVDQNQTGNVTNTATVALPSTIKQDPATNDPDTDNAVVTPQQQTPSILLDKQLYEGHNLGVDCNSPSAVDELVIVDKTQSSKDVTYCFTLANDGNTHLQRVDLDDPLLGITELDMTLLPGSDPEPLAPGDSQTFYYETATNTSVDNTATVSAQPITPGGTPTGQPDVTHEDSNALLVYVFDPPFGEKTGQLEDGTDIITWTMVWINDSAFTASGVVITDSPPEGTTYAGNLSCDPQGLTTVSSCSFDPSEGPRGTVTVIGDIAPDPGATTEDEATNPMIIRFDVTVDSITEEGTTIENQAELAWDPDIDGTPDFNALSDDPTTAVAGDPAAVVIGLSNTGSPAYLGVAVGAGLLVAGVVLHRRRRTVYREHSRS